VADDVLRFLYRVRIWFVYRTFQVSPEKKNSPWKVRYTNQIRTRYRNWRTTSATQLQPSKSLLHRVYINIIRRAQLCTDAGGSHFQHLLWRYVLSAFGYCINFCIYAMLRTRATFSWPTLYYYRYDKTNTGFLLHFFFILQQWAPRHCPCNSLRLYKIYFCVIWNKALLFITETKCVCICVLQKVSDIHSFSSPSYDRSKASSKSSSPHSAI